MTNERCGCCAGVEALTPAPTWNRPGLDALAYRVGTHATFLETMRAALAGHAMPSQDPDAPLRPLQRLRTRSPDDASIALLDAWATTADVLSFYQERIANEGYLRTATERRSVVELGRLVGYQAHPGVGASVHLAFELENPYEIEIPAGTRAQSIPQRPDEQPQFFETGEALDARAAWNTLEPRRTRPQLVTPATARLHFEGTALALCAGDPLLLEFTGITRPAFIEAVETDDTAGRTSVTLQGAAVENDIVASASGDAVATAERFLDMEAFGVNPTGALAQRVAAQLERLRTRLGDETRTAAVLAALAETRRDLQQEAELAIGQGWSVLSPWVSAAVAELERHEAGLRATLRIGGPASGAEPAGGHVLTGLVTQLALPPSRQPASRMELRRPMSDVYAAKADVGGKLLAALNPRVADTLYAAWGSVDATGPGEFRAVHALRTKAAVFGHNAPLAPIVDEAGLVTGHREWPLGPTTHLGLRLSSHQINGADALSIFSDEPSFTAELSAVVGGVTRAGEVHGGDSGHISEQLELGDLHVAFELDRGGADSATMVVRFTAGESGSELGVLEATLAEDPTGLLVRVDGLDERHVRPGETIGYVVAGRQVSVRLGGALVVATQRVLPLPESERRVLALDTTHEEIVPGGWVVLQRAGQGQVFRVEEVRTVSKARYGISARVTELMLDRAWLNEDDVLLSSVRETAVFAVPERLAPAEEPVDEALGGNRIELNRLYDGLEAGRWIIVDGQRADLGGAAEARGTELVMVAGVTQDVGRIEGEAGDAPGTNGPTGEVLRTNGSTGDFIELPGDHVHTFLHLANDLAYAYRRDTVRIYGNVVGATHGETRSEVLGHGDATRAFQRFALSYSPLTFVAAADASGIASTLRVRVDDVLRHEVATLADQGPADRTYVVAIDDEQQTVVTFGDGRRGARLPTGADNVSATYRQGLGRGGNVGGGQISLLASRPLGLKGVVNPLPASGGADPEGTDDARRNIPLAVTSLGRLVSVRDYEDFALGFAGIAKASARLLSDGRTRLVHLTIAGQDDMAIETHSDLYRNLMVALHRLGDPHVTVRVERRRLKLLVVNARVRPHPDHRWETVEPGVRQTLLDTFGFERRALGQSVVLSEIISTAAGVEGVSWVDVDILDAVDESITPDQLGGLVETLLDADQPRQRVDARLARPVDGHVAAAELAYLSPAVPDTLLLAEVAS